MPEVFREGPYRFFFYSNENDEPPHVHVRTENRLPSIGSIPLNWSIQAGCVVSN
jgi:hypothetical protein